MIIITTVGYDMNCLFLHFKYMTYLLLLVQLKIMGQYVKWEWTNE
jgi:hypothetical protein